jgi:transposase
MNGIEFNSIDRFRQFKKQIRGSKEHLIVGLDIAKRKHHGFFGDANGRTLLKGLIVEDSAKGFRHLLTQVRFNMDREELRRVVYSGWSRPASTTNRWRNI